MCLHDWRKESHVCLESNYMINDGQGSNWRDDKLIFFSRKLFHRKEFYIIEILIVSYPSDVMVILISICLIEVTSIVVVYI